MANKKDGRTNAMRILDRAGVPYRVIPYECEEFIDAIHISDMLGQPYEQVFKTLVTKGKSGSYYVFAIPIHMELDLKKAARTVGEKSVEMVHVKDLFSITGYIRGGCTPIGMKKHFTTVIHQSARTLEEMIISGGRIGAQLQLQPTHLIQVTQGIFADIVKEGLAFPG